MLIRVPKKASNLKLSHLHSLLAFVTDESKRIKWVLQMLFTELQPIKFSWLVQSGSYILYPYYTREILYTKRVNFYPVRSCLVRRRIITVVVRVLSQSSHGVCKFSICSLQHEGDVHCHQKAAIIRRCVCFWVHDDDNNDYVLMFILLYLPPPPGNFTVTHGHSTNQRHCERSRSSKDRGVILLTRWFISSLCSNGCRSRYLLHQKVGFCHCNQTWSM